MTKRSHFSFPDTNVWLALAVGTHTHHQRARAWWDSDESEAIGFCRLTQLGLLRLLTTAAAMAGQPLTNAHAWDVYEKFFEDTRVRCFPEPVAMEDWFRRFSMSPLAAPKIWADSYLAAHAGAWGATLITFDQGFTQYRHLIDCTIL